MFAERTSRHRTGVSPYASPVSRCGRFQRLRLRRALLVQGDAQQHYQTDGQKLALRVLQRLKPELRRAKIAERRYGFSAVLELLLAVGPSAARHTRTVELSDETSGG